MGVERWGRGRPLDFENFSKKGCFRSFEWEKTNFTTFAPPLEKFGKIPWWPPLENSSDAQGCLSSIDINAVINLGKCSWQWVLFNIQHPSNPASLVYLICAVKLSLHINSLKHVQRFTFSLQQLVTCLLSKSAAPQDLC